MQLKKIYKLDDVDRRILSIVQEDSRLTYAEIGAKVGLSVSAVNDRLKKMHIHHIIKQYTVQINPQAIGIEVCAFVYVLLESPTLLDSFIEHIKAMPEIQECHQVTGSYSFLLKVRATSNTHLEHILNNKIKILQGVIRTSTEIALSSPKETITLEGPLLDNGPTLQRGR